MLTDYGTISATFAFLSPSSFSGLIFLEWVRRRIQFVVTFSIRHFPRGEVDRPTLWSLPGLQCSPLLRQRLRLSRNTTSLSNPPLPPHPKTTSTISALVQTASTERNSVSTLTRSLLTMILFARYRLPVSCLSKTIAPRRPLHRRTSSPGRTAQ